jgi:hypothetical protein
MRATASMQYRQLRVDHRSADFGRATEYVGVLYRTEVFAKSDQPRERLPLDHLKFAKRFAAFAQIVL